MTALLDAVKQKRAEATNLPERLERLEKLRAMIPKAREILFPAVGGIPEVDDREGKEAKLLRWVEEYEADMIKLFNSKQLSEEFICKVCGQPMRDVACVDDCGLCELKDILGVFKGSRILDKSKYFGGLDEGIG